MFYDRNSIPFDEDDEDDFEDVDCVQCGLKFYVRPSFYSKQMNEKRVQVGLKPQTFPTTCTRCLKGLPPPYEY